jgi:hypothetical protein
MFSLSRVHPPSLSFLPMTGGPHPTCSSLSSLFSYSRTLYAHRTRVAIFLYFFLFSMLVVARSIQDSSQLKHHPHVRCFFISQFQPFLCSPRRVLLFFAATPCPTKSQSPVQAAPAGPDAAERVSAWSRPSPCSSPCTNRPWSPRPAAESTARAQVRAPGHDSPSPCAQSKQPAAVTRQPERPCPTDRVRPDDLVVRVVCLQETSMHPFLCA